MGWFEWMSGESKRRPAGEIDLGATAYHEASHARAAHKRGFTLLGIEVHADGGGRTGFVDAGSHGRALEDHLVALRAGQAGEVRYLMDRGYRRRQAEQMTAHGASSDRARFEAVARGTIYTWEGMRGEADRFVRRHAYTIDKTAKRLLRRGRDSGTWA
ncbi:MAG: hypothetical protein JO272_06640 [Pseudonocardiales bacterium]|nr:hypothetical protein [Pseudonocardiales bacterium]